MQLDTCAQTVYARHDNVDLLPHSSVSHSKSDCALAAVQAGSSGASAVVVGSVVVAAVVVADGEVAGGDVGSDGQVAAGPQSLPVQSAPQFSPVHSHAQLSPLHPTVTS